MYRIGFPFWKQAARLGIPLNIRVDVLQDHEAEVFVATSKDLRGLVCEAATIDELVNEINNSINELLSIQLRDGVVLKPVTDLRLCGA